MRDGHDRSGSNRNPANFSSRRASKSIEGKGGSCVITNHSWSFDNVRLGSLGGKKRRLSMSDGSRYDDDDDTDVVMMKERPWNCGRREDGW